jgi:hypothetical protein
MHSPTITALACGLTVALVGCGDQAGSAVTAARLPASGKAYRALTAGERLAIAATCRDRAAGAARGQAARQLRAIDPKALRAQLDDTFTIIAAQRRSVAAVCNEALAFVTPGLRVSFEGAKDAGDGTFTYETTSDKRLTISGRVAPAPARGRVVIRREVGHPAPHEAAIRADGRFVIAKLHLRKIADNTFTLAIHAPPNAPHKVHFSAICLDCLAGSPPTSTQR